MRVFFRIMTALGASVLLLALPASAVADQDDYPPSTTIPDSEAGDTETVVLPETETVVADEVAQDSDTDGTPAELAFTGRSVGGMLGVAVLAIVVGGVLVVLSRRREGIFS